MKIKELMEYMKNLNPESNVGIRVEFYAVKYSIGKHGDECWDDPELQLTEHRTVQEGDLNFSNEKGLSIRNFVEIDQRWVEDVFKVRKG